MHATDVISRWNLISSLSVNVKIADVAETTTSKFCYYAYTSPVWFYFANGPWEMKEPLT